MLTTLFSYLGLFAWSFLAATLLPLSSEAPLAALVYGQQQVALPVAIATAGNYLGACTTYWVGRRASRMLGRADDIEPRQQRAANLIRRYGTPVLLLSWVPIFGDVLVAVAGAMNVPFIAFSLWVAIGKGIRYLVVALAARQFLG